MVEITGNSDLVHEYDAAGGQWTYTAWQYVPGDLEGVTYFIMQNMYNDFGPYDWSIQLPLNQTAGMITDDHVAGAELPIMFDQWAEIRVEIDLDTDWREVYYGGTLLSARTWTTGTGSLLEIGAVDLFANGASPVYYDDMSLVPAGWSDNFDSYELGSSMHGQGGWKGWDNDPTWTAYVVPEPASGLLLLMAGVLGLRRRR
jgi:hypothetical protein